MLDDKVDSSGDTFLQSNSNSEHQDDEEIEELIDNLSIGQTQCTSMILTTAEPIKLPRVEGAPVIRASPCPSTDVGHACDILPSHRGHHFETALGSNEGFDWDKDAESNDDRSSSTTTPTSDSGSTISAALAMLPPVLAIDGFISASCEELVDEVPVPMEPDFGAELERVPSRRGMVAAVG